jgi:hypothetical protein
MTTLREAAQQFVTDYENGDLGDLKHYARALRAALEQPYAEQARRVEQETHGRMRIDPVTGDVSIGTPTEQEQEPVANAGAAAEREDTFRDYHCTLKCAACGHKNYFTMAEMERTPRREPLSDEELDRLWREPMSADWEHREYARAVEAAHGIKENT